MGHPIQHFEFWSKDPERLSTFYEKAFGWKIQHMPEIQYRLVDTDAGGKGIGGGIMTPGEGEWPGNMSFYVSVPELGPAREQIRAAGGKVIVEEQVIPNVGSFALFEDPDGRVLGIWQEAQHG